MHSAGYGTWSFCLSVYLSIKSHLISGASENTYSHILSRQRRSKNLSETAPLQRSSTTHLKAYVCMDGHFPVENMHAHYFNSAIACVFSSSRTRGAKGSALQCIHLISLDAKHQTKYVHD